MRVFLRLSNNHGRSVSRETLFFVLFLAVNAVLWTVLPTLFCRVLPLDTAEAIMWGSSGGWGNCKHPPLSGFLAYWFSALFGHLDFAVYLLSQLCMATGFFFLYRTARNFFSNAASIMATLMITFFIFYNWETPKFNANIPHLALWPLSAWLLLRAIRFNKWSDWLLLGVVSALSILSKYVGGLLLLGMFLYCICDRVGRLRLRSFGPYAAFAVFLSLLSPHLIWLWRHDFLPFRYVGENLAVQRGYFENLFFTAGALAAPFACIILGACIVKLLAGGALLTRLRPANPEALRFGLCFGVVPAAVVALLAVAGCRIDSMWTYQLYLFSGILVMAFWHGPVAGRVFRIFSFVAVICTATILAIYTVYSLSKSKMRRHMDPVEFQNQALSFYRAGSASEQLPPLLLGDMWACAQLQHQLRYTVPVCVEYDESDWQKYIGLLRRRGALLITENPMQTDALLLRYLGVRGQWMPWVFHFSAPFGRSAPYCYYFARLEGEK